MDIADVPGHVKHQMATRTVSTKIALADAFDQLATPGETVPAQTVSEVASEMLPADRPLDAGQIAAAGAIGGSDRLVTVTGPAGAGKTTMLRVAKSLLDNQGRRLVIVAPTKKAASVAGREVGAESSSLHALLHDWGFRWSDSSNGQVWTRLVPGQTDPETGHAYGGPHHFALRRGDRIVVDEAGMVDLNAAQALASVAKDADAGIAMVGDHLQALPVGHSGAMSLMRTRSTAAVELCAVHRFKDPAWADLSLRLRNPGDDLDAVAYQIVEDGHAVVVATEVDAHRHMADAWMESAGQGKRLAIVTATHEDAQIVNDLVQARRLAAEQLDTTSAVGLQNGQVAYVGDVIQTRRNDRNMNVENRQQWVVQSISAGQDGASSSITLVSLEDSGVSRVVDDFYLAEHSHLSYASTVHGIQGETTDRSLVGPGVDAAGLYVGLTRGREHNAAVVIGDGNAAAREQLMQAMQRGAIEATLDDSQSAARRDLAHAARQAQIPTVDGKKYAPWHDKTARPFGDLVNIDHLLTEAADQEKSLFEQIARLSDKIAIDQAALNEAQLRLAAWDARKHASKVGGGAQAEAPLLMSTIDALQERTHTMRTERNELAQSYRALTQRMSALHREVSIRKRLGNQVSAYEDDARRRRQNHNDVETVPAWNDQKLRPLGHVAALRAKQLSTAAELARITADAEQRASAIAAVQETLRRSKVSADEAIDRAQWERAARLLPHAQVAYDRVVQRRSELTQLMRTIDVEISIREQLHRESPTRSRQEALDRSSQASKTGTPRLPQHEVDSISTG
ncbi:AAA family ATPase [Microbacterium sp. YY-01]|uniref:ATP-dependent DNA helicase n=1 Tax=Microbacterium sp. YY-01 TaxID=3421634 RepID=UPI003D167087